MSHEEERKRDGHREVQLARRAGSVDAALLALQAADVSPGRSMLAVCSAYGLSMEESKEAMGNSASWSAVMQHSDKLSARVMKIAEKCPHGTVVTRWDRSRRVLLKAAKLIGAYTFLWPLMWMVGGSQLKAHVVQEMSANMCAEHERIMQSLRAHGEQLTAEESAYDEENRKFRFDDASSWLPFRVVVEHHQSSGFFTGEGFRSHYIWFFGLKRKLSTRVTEVV